MKSKPQGVEGKQEWLIALDVLTRAFQKTSRSTGLPIDLATSQPYRWHKRDIQ